MSLTLKIVAVILVAIIIWSAIIVEKHKSTPVKPVKIVVPVTPTKKL